MTGASLSWCLPGVINLGSAECHYSRSRIVVQTLEFVFHSLKIFKACRTFFPSYGLSFWLVLLSFQDFLYIFRLWTVANLNGGVEEGDLHAQAQFCTGVEHFQDRYIRMKRNLVNDLLLFQFIKLYHFKM